MSTGRPGPIGIEVSATGVAMLQLRRQGRALKLVAARRRSLPRQFTMMDADYGPAVADAIRAMLAEGSFAGSRAVTCLPAEAVVYKNLRLPVMPADELSEAVQWEAMERLHEKGQSLVTQFFDAGEVRQGDETRREVIAVATPERVVEQHLAAVVSSGLKPSCIEVSASALARLLVATSADQSSASVLVNVRSNSTEVLIVLGGQVRFCKTIGIGTGNLDDAAAQQLGISSEEAAERRAALGDGRLQGAQRDAAIAGFADGVAELGREIGLCLRYYGVTFRGRRPEQVNLVGAAANQPWLAELIAGSATAGVSSWQPMSSQLVEPAETLGPTGWAQWAVTLGLAMRDSGAMLRLPSGREAAA